MNSFSIFFTILDVSVKPKEFSIFKASAKSDIFNIANGNQQSLTFGINTLYAVGHILIMSSNIKRTKSWAFLIVNGYFDNNRGSRRTVDWYWDIADAESRWLLHSVCSFATKTWVSIQILLKHRLHLLFHQIWNFKKSRGTSKNVLRNTP